jgi:hypothetical protein
MKESGYIHASFFFTPRKDFYIPFNRRLLKHLYGSTNVLEIFNGLLMK